MGDEKLENYFRTLGELAKKDHKIRVILRKVITGTERQERLYGVKYHHRLTHPDSPYMHCVMNDLVARAREYNLV